MKVFSYVLQVLSSILMLACLIIAYQRYSNGDLNKMILPMMLFIINGFIFVINAGIRRDL